MLWMVRAFPNQTDRMTEFLESNIIAVHWGIGDLTGCTTKKEVAEVVAQANLQPRDASLKTGLLHRFVNQMKIGDYCIIPYNDVFYTAKITSDYFYDSNSKKYEHQRQVEWLFDGEPFSREILPKQIQTSLKSQLGLADLSQHEPIFKRCINKWNSMDELGVFDLLNKPEESDDGDFVEEQLSSLLNDAMKIIKDEINSDDPDRRLKAAIAVLELNKQTLS